MQFIFKRMYDNARKFHKEMKIKICILIMLYLTSRACHQVWCSDDASPHQFPIYKCLEEGVCYSAQLHTVCNVMYICKSLIWVNFTMFNRKYYGTFICLQNLPLTSLACRKLEPVTSAQIWYSCQEVID